LPQCHTRFDSVDRIRNKVARWSGIPFGLPGVQGIQTRLMHKHLKALGLLVAPRVHAAVFKTLWNGWSTETRFQRKHSQSNRCRFKCSSEAGDSIEHYCRCPVVRQVSYKHLHLQYNLCDALNVWCLNTSLLDKPHILTCVAILIYGAFNAYNSIRHNTISSSSQAYNCIVQHCLQGVSGHGASAKVLGSCGRSPLLALC
jgi:hypothetical protein